MTEATLAGGEKLAAHVPTEESIAKDLSMHREAHFTRILLGRKNRIGID